MDSTGVGLPGDRRPGAGLDAAAGLMGDGSSPIRPPRVRTGAFSRIHVRWLAFWVGVGGLALLALAGLAETFGVAVGDEELSVALYLVVLGWVVVSVRGQAGVRLGAMLRWPRLGTYWWVVAGMFVVQLVFSAAAATVTSIVAPGLDDSLQGLGEGNLAVLVLGLVILPPFVEEIVFRGVLIERLAVRWRLEWAILASAALFGVLHADPVGACAFGIVATLLYLRTGSLWPAILVHLANNLLALALMRLTGDEAAEPAASTASALSSAAFLAALSVPFLVWFGWTHWPRGATLTPYQAYEVGVGLPDVTLPVAGWSVRQGRPVRLTATNSHLVVSEPGLFPEPIASLAFESVAAVYAARAPGVRPAEMLVVVVTNGTWSGFQLPGGQERAHREGAVAIRERIEAARYRAWLRGHAQPAARPLG